MKGFHKNLQRLASLAICTAAADSAQALPTAEIADRYRQSMERPRQLAGRTVDEFVTYVKNRSIIREYSSGRNATLTAVREAVSSPKARVQTQDLLLSEPGLPSTSGREKSDSYLKTLRVCQQLGFVTTDSVTRTISGRMLVRVATERGKLPIERADVNPFSPDPALATATYYFILMADLELQRGLLEASTDEPRTFARGYATDAADLLADLARRARVEPNGRELGDWLKKSTAAARRLNDELENKSDQPRPTSIQTKYRPIEDLMLTRLEFMVDVGLLIKPNPAQLTYKMAAAASGLLPALSSVSAVEERYFSGVAALHGLVQESVQVKDAPEFLRAAYLSLRNAAGYAPIVESTVMATAMAHPGPSGSSWSTLEVSDARQALGALSKGANPSARIVADRSRRASAFKLI